MNKGKSESRKAVERLYQKTMDARDSLPAAPILFDDLETAYGKVYRRCFRNEDIGTFRIAARLYLAALHATEVNPLRERR